MNVKGTNRHKRERGSEDGMAENEEVRKEKRGGESEKMKGEGNQEEEE